MAEKQIFYTSNLTFSAMLKSWIFQPFMHRFCTYAFFRVFHLLMTLVVKDPIVCDKCNSIYLSAFKDSLGTRIRTSVKGPILYLLSDQYCSKLCVAILVVHSSRPIIFQWFRGLFELSLWKYAAAVFDAQMGCTTAARQALDNTRHKRLSKVDSSSVANLSWRFWCGPNIDGPLLSGKKWSAFHFLAKPWSTSSCQKSETNLSSP